MDEAKLATFQTRIDELNAQIEAAEKAGESHEEIWELEKKLAMELGINYREICKLLVQDARYNDATRQLSRSTTCFEWIDAGDEIAENTMILARMSEVTGHNDWAESSLRLAVFHAQEKRPYYEDILRSFYKRIGKPVPASFKDIGYIRERKDISPDEDEDEDIDAEEGADLR